MNFWWDRLWNLAPLAELRGRVNAPDSPFAFYAWQRNPKSQTKGVWETTHGIRDIDLLDHYAEVLEKAYNRLIGMGLPAPRSGRNGKIPIFVCDVEDSGNLAGSPLMEDVLVDGRLVPCILLRSRFRTSTIQTEREQAATEAVHELRHLFNATYLPYRKAQMRGRLTAPDELYRWFNAWLWFDEALCVHTEDEILPHTPSWIALTLDWVDRCGYALHSRDARYQSVMFARYIRRLMRDQRPSILEDVWALSATVWDYHEGRRDEPPHTALSALADRLGREGWIFANPDVEDVFASGYCFDSYFLHVAGTHGHEPQTFERFREQALTRSWHMAGSTMFTEDMELPALACHYLRIFPNGENRSADLHVTTDNPSAALKVETVLVSKSNLHGIEGTRQTLRRQGTEELCRIGAEWYCRINALDQPDCDHALVIVSHVPNIGLGYEDPSPVRFSVKVSWPP